MTVEKTIIMESLEHMNICNIKIRNIKSIESFAIFDGYYFRHDKDDERQDKFLPDNKAKNNDA